MLDFRLPVKRHDAESLGRLFVSCAGGGSVSVGSDSREENADDER